MKLAGEDRTAAFASKHKDLKNALRRWVETVGAADWKNPADMKKTFGSANIVGDQTVPRVPRSKEEKLMKKGEDNLSSAEDALLDTLFAVIQEYERGKYARTKSTPAELLTFLMEENNLSPADLPVPASRVSEITSGKREVNKEQAKRLGAFFHVSPALFI